jgi:hypothetical protein
MNLIRKQRCWFAPLFAVMLALIAAPVMAQNDDWSAELSTDDLPPGKYLYEGDMIISAQQKEDLETKGAFEPNLWPGGVVPYVFVVNSNTAVDTYTGTGLTFIAGTPPRITSTNASFTTLNFRAGEEVRVNGSNSNDNAGSGTTGYIITAASASQLTLTSGDAIVSENATTSTVTIYTTRSVLPANQTRFINAMAGWEAVANVDFRLRNGESDYIQVWNSVRNRADLGLRTGVQDLQMNNWTSMGVIQHEAAHALGVKHEQSRQDRDTYVTILPQNISQTACAGPCNGNFNISPTTADYPTGPDGVYDFGSLMHYSQTAFSINAATLNTIQVNAPWTAEWQNNIGQSNGPSYLDRTTMSFLYPESDWRFMYSASTVLPVDGSFIAPYDDLTQAVTATPAGGQLVLMYPEDLVEPGTYNKAMTLVAPLGAVIRGP